MREGVVLESIFGPETPLAVRFGLLLLFIVILVLAGAWVVRYVFATFFPDRMRAVPKTSLSGRWSIRRAIIGVAGMLALLQVLMLTIGGGISGYFIVVTIMRLNGGNPDGNEMLGLLVGAAVGFVIAAVWSAVIFTLAEIERNTRHTAAMMELLVGNLKRRGE
jgi:hypothetical protein